MNVYFIDPTYVKSEGWKPLLTYLKVKVAYSFISKHELPPTLLSIIEPFLVMAYVNNTDKEAFANQCTYWLSNFFEKNIRLVTEDFKDVHDCPREKRIKYSSRNALNNINNVDENNCMILLPLISRFTNSGEILAPQSIGSVKGRFFPTHIASYCLNILHKAHGNYLYHTHSAFIMFDRYFSKAYEYDSKYAEWYHYRIQLNSRKSLGFMNYVNNIISKISPEDFPVKQGFYTVLRTEEGDTEYKMLIKKAEEAADNYEDEHSGYDTDWNKEVDEMNRDFWRECGEGGSNCESWPGWG